MTLQCTNKPLHPHELQHVQLLQQLILVPQTSKGSVSTGNRAFDPSAAFFSAAEELQDETHAALSLVSLAISPLNRVEFARSQCTRFSVFQRHGRRPLRAQMWANEHAHTQQAKRQLPNDIDDDSDESTFADDLQPKHKRLKHDDDWRDAENGLCALAFACDMQSTREE